MQVRINGNIVERESYLVHEQTRSQLGFGYSLPQHEPEILENEQVIWMLGDPIPTIIRLYEPI